MMSPQPSLDAVACALVLVDAERRVRAVNAAFTQLTGWTLDALRGCAAASLCGGATAASVEAWLRRVIAADADAGALDVEWRCGGGAPALPVRLQARRDGTGACLTLLDRRAELDALRRAERAAELLATAQEFGRFGIWERNVRTSEGRWDRHVYRFWGLPEGGPTPSFAEAVRSVVPEDRDALNRVYLGSLARAGVYSAHYRVRSADGAVRRLHSQWAVRNGADGRPEHAQGVLTDDTEVWRLAQSVSDAQDQLRLAVELGGIAIWRHDLPAERLYFSDEGWRMLGLAPRADGIAQLAFRALIHPDDHAHVQATRERALASRAPVDMHARYRHADGRWLDILTRRVTQRDETDTPVAFIGVAMDVTGQRAEQRALRDANARVALAARAVGFGTWETDGAGQEATWDEQMWRLRGLEPRGPVAPGHAERMALVHPDDARAIEAEYAAARAEGRPWSIEFRVRWPDGSWRWLASRSMPELDADGRQLRRIGVNWDITDARNAEQSRQARLEAQRESRAKSAFMARMSHELRTPLHAVIGFAQLLLGDDTLPAGGEARDRVGHIRDAGQHLLALVDDVLDLTSLDTGELRLESRCIELRAALDALLPMVAPQARALGIRIDAAQVDHAVQADPTRLRQVVLNLLSNAVKYNRRDGQVRLCSRVEGDRVVLEVHDSGRGMSAEQLAHVFEPFNRLGAEHEGIEGTGIGLAIVKINVERMGGTVAVRSQAGAGSCFEVRLPAGRHDAATTAAIATTGSPIDPGGNGHNGERIARVLYIEDNPVNALIVRELIAQRRNLQLDEAADGGSGIERARALLPDLILLDMQLPDIDGLEVLRRLRADTATAAIPCIALSANAMPDDIQSALRAGFADYWTKPLDFGVFMSALDTLFGRATV